jgi:acyl-CoA synthetase (AMP-forming)/AMP-acid ligase II
MGMVLIEAARNRQFLRASHESFLSLFLFTTFPFLRLSSVPRILKVSEEDKSVPFRDPKTGLCQVAGPNEVGLIVNVVNNKIVQSRFDGYSDASATSKKLLTDVLAKGDCYFNSGDLLYRDEEGFYYW